MCSWCRSHTVTENSAVVTGDHSNSDKSAADPQSPRTNDLHAKIHDKGRCHEDEWADGVERQGSVDDEVVELKIIRGKTFDTMKLHDECFIKE